MHPVDQLYYVVLGEMQLQLGAERFVAGPDTLVYIPAGTPHHNWNEGDVDEFHFEVLAPGADAQPDGHDADRLDRRRRASVRACARSPTPRSRSRCLASPCSGCCVAPTAREHVSLYIGSVEPGAGGPGTHVHAFDQFYFVLDGTMTVEVGLERHVAEPFTLVVLPAGVPHRQFNEARRRPNGTSR